MEPVAAETTVGADRKRGLLVLRDSLLDKRDNAERGKHCPQWCDQAEGRRRVAVQAEQHNLRLAHSRERQRVIGAKHRANHHKPPGTLLLEKAHDHLEKGRVVINHKD